QPQEIDVQRQVVHGIELEVARDDTVLGAVHLELVDRGEEAPGIDALLELGVIDRDVERRLAVAVDHARYATGATLGPGGPLAGPRARRRLHLLDGRRHDANPLATKRPRSCGPSSPRGGMPPGVSGPRSKAQAGRSAQPAVGALIAATMGKDKKCEARLTGDENAGRAAA